MITKIEFKERIWEKTIDAEGKFHFTEKYLEPTAITREEHKGNFDKFILKKLDDNGEIRDYAEDVLDMIDEDDCECDETRLSDFNERFLISELEDRGYKVIKCQTIADSMKLEKIKELMEL